MTDKLAQVAEALRRRKTARFPAVTVEGQMPKRVAIDVPPEFQAQEAELKKVQNLGQPEAEQPRPGSVPAQVSQAMLGAAPVVAKAVPQVDDEADIEAAREADRESRFAAGMELAGRQLVGGITRTPVPQGLGVNPSEVPLAMARAKSKREQAAEALMRQRQGRLDENTLANSQSERDLRMAQAARALREPTDKHKNDADELASYKAVMTKRYPDAAALINGVSSMKGAQDLQNALEGDLTRASNERVGDKAAFRADRFRQDAEARADADAKAKKLEADAAAFGKDTAGRAVFSKRLAELESTIPKTGSVPGTGILGDALAWFDSKAGTDFQSPEAIKVRQNIGLLMSAILREQSGATVSEQEYARAVQNGLSTQNAATTREALRRLRDEFAITERDIRAKYSPEAVSLYEGRQKKTAAPSVGKPSPGPGYVRGKAGGQSGWYNAKTNDWVAD